jgi:hypothetical protein
MKTQWEYHKVYYQKKPWARYIANIMRRCNDKREKYYKKGIKNYLTVNDLETLWVRDKAYLMASPSIDRIDSTKDYTFRNCQFIELLENKRKNWQGRRKVNKGAKQ